MTHRMRCSNSGPLRATNWAVLSTMLLMSGGGCSTPLTVAGALDGTTVCAVCPGTTLTERTSFIAAALNEQETPTTDATQNMIGDIAEQTPLGRVGTPADVARTVAFLASAEADYTTGVALLVAGGIQM